MPKIRHIGISTDDVHGTADFYIEAFGMIEIDRSDRKGPQNTPEESWAVLSDGYINVTILKFKEDRYGGGSPHLHHFGFHVEDLDAAGKKVIENGGKEVKWWNDEFGNGEGDENNWVGEKKYTSPQGIALDVNPSGWRMFPGGSRGEDS